LDETKDNYRQMLIELENINFEHDIAVSGYDKSIISILNAYAFEKKTTALVEFGRGNGNLFSFISDASMGTVSILEDFDQTIFQGDSTQYKDLEVTTYNAFAGKPLDQKFDFIYCSLPNMIPGFEQHIFESRLKMAFENLMLMLNEDGILITVDFNTQSIKTIIESLDKPYMPYIQTNDDDINPAYYMCAIKN
jgi:hypothetical protein